MIDPSKITNFYANEHELQELILFWILAANKNGTIAARNLDRLLDYIFSAYACTSYATFKKGFWRPFELINIYGMMVKNDWWLQAFMKQCGIGMHGIKSKCILDLIHSDMDLKTCSIQDLESIKGIGQKTSRCFVIHTRKNAWYAGLDTHALKFLRDNGYPDAPKSTPSNRKIYNLWESRLLEFIPEGVTAAEWDLKNWNNYKVKVQHDIEACI